MKNQIRGITVKSIEPYEGYFENTARAFEASMNASIKSRHEMVKYIRRLEKQRDDMFSALLWFFYPDHAIGSDAELKTKFSDIAKPIIEEISGMDVNQIGKIID